ncbi:MAG TPA: four-carbon acid sugar kinase family protein [Geminicoccaceae bacterium]|nr:four-carbon acid sugar kinase family protein [Geminicoccaceae bacterium]
MLIRIVADDLTGALDSAAPLSQREGPLPVFWRSSAIEAGAGSLALDTDSRDASRTTSEWLGALRSADLAYKKIDSLLRGNTAREIAACLASGWFRSALIAPAFPAQQRITRGGHQFWRPDPSEPWQAVPCDLAAELRGRGVDLRLASAATDITGSGFFLCDAESEDDLHALVSASERLAAPLLWCGSAGLARALAGVPAEGALPRLEPPLLLVIGSHHPVTLAQIRALAEHAPDLVIRIRHRKGKELEPMLKAAAPILTGNGRAALVIEVPDGTGAAVAAPFYDRVLTAAASCLERPRSLVVTGGATLHRLVGVLGARSLLVTGEPLPGIPRSVLQGGRWDGAVVVSKSGAFGDPELLIRLLESAKGGSHD